MRITVLTPEYWEMFKANVRELDVKEVLLQHPSYTIDKWNYEDVKGSFVAVSDDGKTVYAVGSVEREYDNNVWVLCTNAVHECPIEFLRFTKTIFSIWVNGNLHMGNIVWLGNELHTKWLKWLGAVFTDKYVINGEEFQRFDFYKPKE